MVLFAHDHVTFQKFFAIELKSAELRLIFKSSLPRSDIVEEEIMSLLNNHVLYHCYT